MSAAQVPEARIRRCNSAEVRRDGEYVLYWMIAARRTRHNFAFQRAVEWCRELGKPLVVLEALRCGYKWASDRLHHFVIQGMADNAASLEPTGVLYYPYLETKQGAGSGLLETLAKQASVILTDDFPCFFLPRMVAAAANKLGVRLEAIDGNGLLPMRASDKAFARAYDFRRFLQQELPNHLGDTPKINPLSHVELPKIRSLPGKILEKWPKATAAQLSAPAKVLADLPIDHRVSAAAFDGGMEAALSALKRFIDRRLNRYEEHRNDPDEEAASGFSPYLHFGHLSAHEVFHEIAQREDWNPGKLSKKANGSREGWWGMSSEAEAFLDEMITWRELGYNMCSQRDDYDEYASLPDWAQATLKKHTKDRREHVYSLEEFEGAETHDPLWNAAQHELVTEGRMQNYLRMLWGKKILEWSATPQEALEVMLELNNKYAVDGRNPNSYSGIFWVLGRYDRPWGPERPIYGTIRYMTSESTMRKLKLKNYLRRHDASRNGQKTLDGF